MLTAWPPPGLLFDISQPRLYSYADSLSPCFNPLREPLRPLFKKSSDQASGFRNTFQKLHASSFTAVVSPRLELHTTPCVIRRKQARASVSTCDQVASRVVHAFRKVESVQQQQWRAHQILQSSSRRGVTCGAKKGAKNGGDLKGEESNGKQVGGKMWR